MVRSANWVALGWAFYIASVQSVLVNVTIDDAHGDPVNTQQIVYDPSDSWVEGSSVCAGSSTASSSVSSGGGGGDHSGIDYSAWCATSGSVNASMTNEGTWHVNRPVSRSGGVSGESASAPSATVHFTGSSVYIQGVIPSCSRRPNLSFYIDDNWVGIYPAQDAETAVDCMDNTPEYGVELYSNANLDPGFHELVVTVGGGVLLLDSIIYSFDNDTAADGLIPAQNSSGLSSIEPSVSATSNPPALFTGSRSAAATTSSVPSPTPSPSDSASTSSSTRTTVVAASVSTIAGLIVIVFILTLIIRQRRKHLYVQNITRRPYAVLDSELGGHGHHPHGPMMEEGSLLSGSQTSRGLGSSTMKSTDLVGVDLDGNVVVLSGAGTKVNADAGLGSHNRYQAVPLQEADDEVGREYSQWRGPVPGSNGTITVRLVDQ